MSPDLGVGILRAMGKGTTEPGYKNRNGQVVVRPTHLPGTDHNQYIYVLRCGVCGHEYGANGLTSTSAGAQTVKACSGAPGRVVENPCPEYPGLTLLEIGASRCAREEGAFSYRNCTVAQLGGEVIGMLHAYPVQPEQEGEAGEPLIRSWNPTPDWRCPAATT